MPLGSTSPCLHNPAADFTIFHQVIRACRFSVEWSGRDGLDEETHGGYIKEFCDHFYNSILKLVDNAVRKNDELMTDRIYADILQV